MLISSWYPHIVEHLESPLVQKRLHTLVVHLAQLQNEAMQLLRLVFEPQLLKLVELRQRLRV